MSIELNKAFMRVKDGDTFKDIDVLVGSEGISDVKIGDNSIVENRVANIPVLNEYRKYGLPMVFPGTGFNISSSSGNMYVNKASNANIDDREHLYNSIVPNNLDYAVKAAMTDGKGAEWTESEQASAQERIGLGSTKADLVRVEDSVETLEEFNEGNTYSLQTDTTEAYSKTVPSNAKRATVKSVGGKSEVHDGEIISADVTSVDVVGKNLYDAETYPMTTGKWTSGQSGIVNTDALYSATLDYIPVEHIRCKNITIPYTGGYSVGVAFYSAEKEFVLGAKYNNLSSCTTEVPSNASYMRFSVVSDHTNDAMIVLGSTVPESYFPYTNKSIAIPSAIRNLTGYGQSHESDVNTLDIDNKVFHRKGYYNGENWVNSVEDVDVSAYLDDSFVGIEVESGGSVTFKQSGVYELDVPSTVQYKVKNDLTSYYKKPSSGIPETDLSDDVQTKLNSGGSAEKEWVLKGALTTDDISTGVNVDLTGCTELIVTGSGTATGNANLYNQNSSPLCNTLFANGTRYFLCYWENMFNRIIPLCGLCGSSNNLTAQLNIVSLITQVSSITSIKISHPDRITSCDIKIYAR